MSDEALDLAHYREGVATMRERGYSLIKLGDRWYFVRVGDDPTQISGGIMRFGHFATPEEAIGHLATLGLRDI